MANETYTIELDASASFNNNDYPQFLLLVDGHQIGNGVVDSNNVEAFSFQTSLASGQSHTVAIQYTNHTASSQLLNVRSIVVNGQTISSSDPSEVYNSSNGTYARFGQMYFGGEIDFNLPASTFPASSTTTPVTPPPTPTPPSTPVTPASTTIGSGPDTLAILLSEDAYNGDAQFTVSIDGTQIGGVQTVTASHAAGQTQTFNVLGTFGATRHTVTINFLNDAYGGTATTDRNLYVTGATIAGTSVGNVTLNEYSAGPQNFTFQNAAAVSTTSSSPATVTLGSGADTLSLSVSEDAYQGDAQFTISVDGTQIGGVQTAAANHATGQTQTFNVLGNFGTTQHTVAVNFLNDAYGGTAATDRNLYVTGGTLNGTAIATAVLNETAAGPQSFSFGTAAVTPPPSTGTPASTPTGPAFYVSPTGSDSGTGSASSPFATIQHALSQMAAGTVRTLYLQSGTYNVSATIALGTAGNGYSILAASGATPVLNAVNGTSTILSLAGTQGATISGLTFQNASFDPQGAALLLSGAGGNTVTGNHFSGNGEAVLLTSSSSNTFNANTITNSATSAFEIKDASNGNLFSNNVIDGVGATNLSGGGFYVHGGSNDTISNNLIQNTAGAGIAIEDFGYGTTTNVGNVITRNEILNTSTSAASTDDGAIYILGRGNNDLHTTVSMNFIRGVGNVNPNAHVEGIYLDDNASGVTVTSNIVAGVQSDATELHGGYNDHFTNNIFDLGTATRTAALIQQPEPDHPATVQPGLTNDAYSGNIIISQQTMPYYVYVYFDPEAVNVPIFNNLYYDPQVPAGGPANSGVYFNPNSPAHSLPTVSPVADSSPVVGNPNFVASTLGSYGLGAGSAASQIGFVPIDTSLIGPH